MAAEIRSADNGKYVISNWRHDYNRFDLMVMAENRQDVEHVIKDVGKILKKDHATGLVWFNREVYNYQTGVSNYDIYQFDNQGKAKRVTKGKRCLAFDVAADHLIYAEYENGTTRIVLRYPDGLSETLKTFSYDTSVYQISMITKNSAILTIGTGVKMTIGILANGKFELLWPNINVDIHDGLYAGKDRIMFVSTIDGTPQLYWCDLKKDKHLWYKISDGVAGIRYPAIDWSSDMPSVSCSVYENSAFLRYRLYHPFSTKDPVSVTGFSKQMVKDESKKDGQHIVSQGKETVSSFIRSTPSFYLQLDSNQDSVSDSDISTVSTSIIAPGAAIILQNAPDNFKVGMSGEMNLPVGYNTIDESFPSYGIWSELDIWQLKLRGEYFTDAYISEYEVSGQQGRPDEYVSIKKEIVDIKSSLAYQLFKDDYITVSYETQKISGENTFQWKNSNYIYVISGENSLTIDMGDLYEGNIWSVEWEHFSYSSRFDPGNLGGPYFSVNAGVDRIDNEYPGLSYVTKSIFSSKSNTVDRIHYGLAQRWMLLDSKLSLKVRVDGFSYGGAVKSDKLSPYMYEVVGRESMFSGYSGDIMALEATRIYGEARYNPFISIFDETRWLERMHVGIKLEGGRVEYFNGATETAELISFESAVRYAFFLRPDRQSLVYIKYAIPLKDMDDIEETTSSRIYFGLTIR
ncbi:MAG: hypothetical protein GY855_14870 [candidate division Zixibacteria bacterium]|nr:hypothetical protein [candidate division Zixibacteria bacterium]